jgi:hypothetical protein
MLMVGGQRHDTPNADIVDATSSTRHRRTSTWPDVDIAVGGPGDLPTGPRPRVVPVRPSERPGRQCPEPMPVRARTAISLCFASSAFSLLSTVPR